MKLVFKIFFIMLLVGLYSPQDSYARLFAPGGDDAIGTNPEPYIDTDKDEKYDNGEPYSDLNDNGQWDAGYSPDMRNMTYSATWDASFPNVVCLYNRLKSPPELVINKFFITDSSKILFGIDDPGACPLPGRKIFASYPNSVAGEFLISGVICVVNTIIFDAMFKVYCAIILWFYNILYAMIIIYVMFYGLSIMLGIGNDVIREAPKRVFKIVLIFFFAVNAQFGFRFIHNGFLSALNGFTDMLTEVQPYYTEQGQPAYQKSFLSNLAASLTLNVLDGPGKLLDQNGNRWKPIAGGQNYYYLDAADPSFYQVDQIPQGANTAIGNVAPRDYVPFRNPAQQWSYQKSKSSISPGGSVDPELTYKILPVFKELQITKAYMDSGKIACIIDVRWDEDFIPDPTKPTIKGALVEYPRCNKNFLPTLAEIAPFGAYGIYSFKDGKLIREEYRTVPISTAPQRLKDTQDNMTETCETLDLVGAAINLPKTCRKPFQGIFGKVDAAFNATVGDDSSKSLGALAGAILLWGSGAGILLSLLLMTGIVTLFVAFFQLIWTYVTSIMALTFLLMLSPIFVSCALFKITDKFFQGWLSALISYTMQPFLIMAFLFVISNMTTLNRLEGLTKEVGKSQKTADIGGTGSVIRTLTSSFRGPLYEKPYDFDKNYYVSGGGSEGKIYINAAQRAKYISSKGEKILDCWLIAKTGTPCSDLYLKNNQTTALGWGSAAFYKELWNSGTGTEPGTGAEIKTGKSGGILAIAEYADKYANNKAEAQEFLTCYKEGCTINGDKIPGLAGFKPGAGIDYDDGDSFLGEPGPVDAAGAANVTKEYPICQRFCPEFNPAYDISKSATTNPRINVPTEQKYPNGAQCPLDDKGNITTCAPNAECTANCMEIKSALEQNYGILAGSILLWILVNAVTVSFVSKIPALAEALSKWSSYAPSGMPLGGASRSWDEEGMDAWTQQEKSGFYHMGGLFDTGVVSGRASGIFAVTGALGRVAQGPHEILNKDGSITKSPRGVGDRKKDSKAADNARKAKKEFLNMDGDGAVSSNEGIKIGPEKLANIANIPITKDFASLRTNFRTGMAHRDMWKIIEQIVNSPSNANASYDTIRTMIDKEVRSAIENK